MHLKKGISLFGVFSIASGAMISSGIFILPGLAFAKSGPAIFVAYFLAGVLALIGVFSVIELSTAMPKAGGDYFFINKTFGPLMGTISGFLGWFALSLKSAFAIFGISEIIFLYTGINPLFSGLLLCILFVFVNIVGVKEAAIFQTILIISLLICLIIYIVIGLPQIETSRFKPLFTVGVDQLLYTSGFVFISFGGLLKVANVSEEVINPKKNIPLGMISSIVVVTVLYTLITIVITGTLDHETFRTSLTPVADSALLFMGTPGYIIIIIASLLAFITTANAGIMAASRYPLALSRDQLLPPRIAGIYQRFNTPSLAIIVTGIIIFLSLLLPLETLVKGASTIILTSYVLTNLSVIILRESKLTNYKPSFKTPFYPWIQIFCIIVFSYFIIDLGKDAIELSLSFLFISFCFYMFYGRKMKEKEFALLHLLKKITDGKLLNNTLETELREIIIHRDQIEQDNFDHLIKEAVIMEVKEKMDFKGLLNMISGELSKKLEVSEEVLINGFLERQNQSNTAISDFLAIPHIILEGEGKTFLMIIRSREGIFFTENENKIKAVFLLAGTKDKRLLHLKTLASIATLVSQDNFENQWTEAGSNIELQNLMLLNARKRFH